MGNRYARVLIAGGAATLVAALGMSAAVAAAKTWTVRPGGAITGDVNSKCRLFTMFKDGGPATLSATFAVRPHQDITSP